MQDDHSSTEPEVIEDIISKAKAEAEAIERMRHELTTSAGNVATAQEEASSALTSITTTYNEINDLLSKIKNYAAESQIAHEESKAKAKEIESLAIDLDEHKKNGSAAETSLIKKEKDAQSILEATTELQNKITLIADTAKVHTTEIQAILGQVTTSRDAVLNLHDKAKTDSKNIAGISATAQEVDGRVQNYETTLTQLHDRFEKINEKIENLLPGATSVGLAKAFNERKVSLKSQINWARGLFLSAILGFLLLGFYGLSFEGIDSISKFFIFVFERSPIVVGLVLLEEFGRRLYSHTLRLEEDYAYKETISLSFDGYKKALAEIDHKELTTPASGAESLAKLLSSNVLSALNERPGRIYEEKKKI